MMIRHVRVVAALLVALVFGSAARGQMFATQAYAQSGAPEQYVANRMNIFEPTCWVRTYFTDGTYTGGSGTLVNNGWSILTSDHSVNAADGRVVDRVEVGWGMSVSGFHTTITAPASGVVSYNGFTSGGWTGRFGHVPDLGLVNLPYQITSVRSADIYRGADIGANVRLEVGGFGTLAWSFLPPDGGIYTGNFQGGWDLTRVSSQYNVFSDDYMFIMFNSGGPVDQISANYGFSGTGAYTLYNGEYVVAGVHSFSTTDEYTPGRSNGMTRMNHFLGWYDSSVVPAPGSIALLLLGGLVAGRRRRAV